MNVIIIIILALYLGFVRSVRFKTRGPLSYFFCPLRMLFGIIYSETVAMHINLHDVKPVFIRPFRPGSSGGSTMYTRYERTQGDATMTTLRAFHT